MAVALIEAEPLRACGEPLEVALEPTHPVRSDLRFQPALQAGELFRAALVAAVAPRRVPDAARTGVLGARRRLGDAVPFEVLDDLLDRLAADIGIARELGDAGKKRAAGPRAGGSESGALSGG